MPLIIKFQVKSNIYKVNYNNEKETIVKRPNNELLAKLYESIISRKKTSFIPYKYSIEISENLFVNEKFGIIKILLQEFNFSSGILDVKFIFSFDTEQTEFEQEDIESIIFDGFNQTYSDENYSIHIEDYIQEINNSNWYEFEFKIEDTPENIIWNIF
jgi:hypothetical protein